MRDDRDTLDEPQPVPPAEWPGRDADAEIEGVTGQHHGTRRAAGDDRSTLVGLGKRSTDGAAIEHAHQVGRLPAREVDEVGLADRLRGPRIVGAGTVAHEHRLDLRTELPEMGDTHRRPAGEHLLPVRERRRRQDGHARARPAGRGEQAGIKLEHRGKELSGADERHGSGHGGESTPTLLERSRRCETAPIRPAYP